MKQLEITANVSTTCPTCHHYPLAIINGRQVGECALCYARTVRLLANLYSDFALHLAADRLDTANEQAQLISIQEELDRR